MAQFKLSVVTPTGSVLDTDVSEATVPGAAGEFGMYADHQPALIMLGGGLLSYQGSDANGSLLIRGGVAEVGPDALLILTDHAVLPEDAERAEAESILEHIVETESSSDSVLDDERIHKLAIDRGYAEALIKVAGH